MCPLLRKSSQLSALLAGSSESIDLIGDLPVGIPTHDLKR